MFYNQKIKNLCFFSFLFFQTLYSKSFYHISDDHKFIYFLVPKTGYTSLRCMIDFGGCSMSQQIYGQIDPHLYPNYFKFTIVRNPWDRALSAYKHLSLHKLPIAFFLADKHDSFEDFVDYLATEDVYEKCSDLHIMAQSAIIPEGLDFIGRFENLEHDVKFILSKLGIKDPMILHYNKTEHDHYSRYYNERTKQIIAEKYKEDIERFGYVFEEEVY